MIDLHCHTNISDNSMSIYEVISLAKNRGVTHLAITDHDTTKGLPEAIEIGEKLGVKIIPGIEISAFDFKSNRRAHILGYYVEIGHPALEALCRPMIERRHRASFEMVEKLRRAGYNITWEQVQAYAKYGTGVYKQHIMNALIVNGYADEYYGELYKKLFRRGSEGGSAGLAYVPLQYIDAVEAIQAVRAAGGVPILAHPKLYQNFDRIEEWVEAGLEGIEVRHPSHTKADEEMVRVIAKKYQLLQTGGSDFHGVYGDHPYQLGDRSIDIVHVYALEKRALLRQN